MDILLKIVERMDFGTILAMVVMFGFFYQRLETKIDKVEVRLGQRIDKVEESLSQRIDKVEERIDKVEESLSQRIDKVEERIDKLEVRIDNVEQSLNQKIDNLEEKLRKEMSSNTKEINSRIDSLYNFMFTLCGYKRDVLDRQDDSNKAA
ncbi:MAG: hypothetical protein L6V95_03335 [Candidatus Melainabacteria bacterium]|nr:MAG: hypothetical protein L6V95_03335 [Candidatus Melainabacteria bacterium]